MTRREQKPPKGWVLLKKGDVIPSGYMWSANFTHLWRIEKNQNDVWIGKKYQDGLCPFARRLPAKRGKGTV